MDNTDVFESVFGRYGRVAVGIYLLLQYETAYNSSPELQPYVAAVFADLLEMVSSTAMSCVEGFKSKESDQIIGRNVDAAFVTYAKRFSTHWNCVVDAHTCLLYTSDAADDSLRVDFSGRRILKNKIFFFFFLFFFFFFFFFYFFFFFSSRRRHTRFLPVSWARRCV